MQMQTQCVALNSLDAKVPAELSQLLGGIVAAEEVDAPTHIPPHGQLLITGDKQPTLPAYACIHTGL